MSVLPNPQIKKAELAWSQCTNPLGDKKINHLSVIAAGRGCNPPHTGNRAAHAADAIDRFCGRLDHHGHVKGVGVHERVALARDRHMTSPEDKVAARELKR